MSYARPQLSVPFILTPQGEFYVAYPSRLGNVITAFETYPDSRYGMDGVFYWPRLWLKLEKDTREEIDSRQAIADSTVYTSFILAVSGCLWLFYAILQAIGIAPFRFLPSLLVSWIVSLLCFLSAYLAYRLSFWVQAQFGEVIKAMFDDYRAKLDQDIDQTLKEIVNFTGDHSFSMRPRRQKYGIVWRYLNFYRIECPCCGGAFLPQWPKSTYTIARILRGWTNETCKIPRQGVYS